MKNSIVIKRVKSFLIDYLIILIYIGLLLGATLLLSKTFNINLNSFDLVTGQLTGFATLTLPVILYFTLSEWSRHSGTIGKSKFHLQVVSHNCNKAGFWQLLFRNCIKFLPWELAHFFIFSLFQFFRNNSEPPNWILYGLVISQGLAVIYLLCMIFNKSHRSIYELFSFTRVIQK